MIMREPRSTMPQPGRSAQVNRGVICIALGVLIAGGAGHRLIANWLEGHSRRHSHLRSRSGRFRFNSARGPVRTYLWIRKFASPGHGGRACQLVYENRSEARSVSLYAGFEGRARARLGHRPDLCYPTHGFEKLSQEMVELTGPQGTRIPEMLDKFRPPEPGGACELVLAAYIVNGAYLSDVATTACTTPVALSA